jgi:hypothetical protein
VIAMMVSLRSWARCLEFKVEQHSISYSYFIKPFFGICGSTESRYWMPGRVGGWCIALRLAAALAHIFVFYLQKQKYEVCVHIYISTMLLISSNATVTGVV